MQGSREPVSSAPPTARHWAASSHFFSTATTLTGSHYPHFTSKKNVGSERLGDFPKVTQLPSSRYEMATQESHITMALTEVGQSNQVLLTTHKGFS